MLADAGVVSDDVTVLDTVLIIGIVTVTTVPVLCDFETDVEVIMTPGIEVAIVVVRVIIINDVSVVVVVTGGCDSVSVTSVVMVVYVVVIFVVADVLVTSGSSSALKVYDLFAAYFCAVEPV